MPKPAQTPTTASTRRVGRILMSATRAQARQAVTATGSPRLAPGVGAPRRPR